VLQDAAAPAPVAIELAPFEAPAPPGESPAPVRTGMSAGIPAGSSSSTSGLADGLVDILEVPSLAVIQAALT